MFIAEKHVLTPPRQVIGAIAMTFMLCLSGSVIAENGLPSCGYRVDVVGMVPCSSGNPPAGDGRAVNASGYMVGYRTTCPFSLFYEAIGVGYWPFATVLTRPAGVVSAQARGVNDALTIVGGARIQNGDLYRGFVRNAQGQWTLLEPQAGGTHAEAFAVNNANVVVGARGDSTNTRWLAFRWENGVYTDLDLPVGPHAYAIGISDDGAITGWMGLPTPGGASGFVLQNGTLTVYPPPDGAISCRLHSINSAGDAVGVVTYPAAATVYGTRAVLARGGRLVDLGTLPERPSCGAFGISEDGIIIGGCNNPLKSIPARAFVWKDGVLTDLEDLMIPTPDLESVMIHGISSTGILAGTGRWFGRLVPVRLVPIHRPAADLNHDCIVDGRDLGVLLQSWGQVENAADINQDGVVNAADLGLLLGSWGDPASPPQPPW